MIESVKKLHISFFSLIFILFLFGTVSYAWLSMSIINNLENITIMATSGNELEISLDGETYYNDIPLDQLDQLLKNIRLDDVTSQDGIHFIRGGVREPESATRNVEYLSFEIYFRTVRPENHVYLVNNVNHKVLYDTSTAGTFAVSKGVSWAAKHTYQNSLDPNDLVEKGDTRMYYASDAVRISIIEARDERNILDIRESHMLNRVIYDPSEDDSRGYGMPFGANHYFEIETGTQLDYPTEIPQTIYELTTFHELNPYQALNNNSLIATLQPTGTYDERGRAYYTSKIRINVWIEGWDPDTFDCILEDRIKVQLQFKVANKA